MLKYAQIIQHCLIKSQLLHTLLPSLPLSHPPRRPLTLASSLQAQNQFLYQTRIQPTEFLLSPRYLTHLYSLDKSFFMSVRLFDQTGSEGSFFLLGLEHPESSARWRCSVRLVKSSTKFDKTSWGAHCKADFLVCSFFFVLASQNITRQPGNAWHLVDRGGPQRHTKPHKPYKATPHHHRGAPTMAHSRSLTKGQQITAICSDESWWIPAQNETWLCQTWGRSPSYEKPLCHYLRLLCPVRWQSLSCSQKVSSQCFIYRTSESQKCQSSDRLGSTQGRNSHVGSHPPVKYGRLWQNLIQSGLIPVCESNHIKSDSGIQTSVSVSSSLAKRAIWDMGT